MLLNKKLHLLTATALCLSSLSFAQLKQFTMEEATNGLYTSLKQKGLDHTSWEPGTNKLYHVVKTDDGQAWVSLLFPGAKADTVLRLSEINKGKSGKEVRKSLPSIHWIDKGLVYYKDGNTLVQGVNTGGGFRWFDWIELPEDAENIKVDKHLNVAYTVKNNLWLVDRDRKHRQVTNDADENVINGQSVHRNEFGIDGGIFLSPLGNYIAYYHMDQTMVNDYPVVDWSVTPAKVNNIKYPMAGGTSHHVKVRVFNPTTGATTEIKTEGPLDQYLTCVTWGPDEEYLYIAVLNREQNHMWLNKYNAATGAKVATLFEESHPKYVEPQHQLTFLPGEKDKFIWWSQRDGFMHLYVYDTKGNMIRQLTKGEWVVNEIDGINANAHQLIISTSKESPLDRNTYTLDWDNGRMKRIDKEEGNHYVSVSEGGDYILDEYSSANVPKHTVVRGTGRNDYEYTAIVSPDPLSPYERPEVRDIVLPASNGTPLYGRLILPIGFNPRNKYPVIVYLYNGPHVQLVKNSYPASRNLWYEYLAQHGYVVFTMDGRGSDNRGREFEQATFRHLGKVEMEDQLVGVDYLKSQPFIDNNRMGVHGWSFGGFMTTSLMLRHPGVFKVGVAGGPVIDWSMYEVMYTERYMDTPQENPEGYAENNLLTKVDNLKGKLLMIHGTDDDVVVWQHSIKFIKKSVDENTQVDYFVYPGHPHNVRGKDRVHLMQKITDYFDLYLKP